MTTEKDFIAVINFSAGGVFGRDSDPVKAVERARKEANGFAKAFGGFKAGTTLKAGLFDATGLDQLAYGPDGVFDDAGKPVPFVRLVPFDPAKPFTPADYSKGMN